MMQGIFRATALPALEQTVVFAQRRHELLAGNMANIDTPDYRARDLSVERFESSLAAAIERQNGPAPRGAYSPDQLADAGSPSSVQESMETLIYHDGSDLNMEVQVAKLAKNEGMHNLAIALMRSQFSVLNAAITERV